MSGVLLIVVALAIFAGYHYYKNAQKQAKSLPKKGPKEETKDTKGKKGKAKEVTKEAVKEAVKDAVKEPVVTNKTLLRQEVDAKKAQKKIKKSNPTHPAFLRGFKGFRDRVVDFDVSPDGKCVVACSPDGTFRVYRSNDLNEQEPLAVYQKIDFYEPGAISLRHDKKMVAIGMGDAKMVEFYSLEEYTTNEDDDDSKTKIKISLLNKSQDKLHKTTLKHLFLDFEGKFYVTGSDEDDTSIKAWSLSGENLGTFTTAQLKNHHILRSENGHFLAVGAWTSDVMILELKTNKDGSLKSLGKAMTLKGHRQGIIDLSFNNSSDKVVTLSKDQTLKLWDINVRYEMSEDPRCLATINVTEFEELKTLNGLIRVALYSYENGSRDIIVVSFLSDIVVFDVQKNKVIETIQHAHSEGSKIYKLAFKEHQGKPYLYSCGDDGRVNMWKFENL